MPTPAVCMSLVCYLRSVLSTDLRVVRQVLHDLLARHPVYVDSLSPHAAQQLLRQLRKVVMRDAKGVGLLFNQATAVDIEAHFTGIRCFGQVPCHSFATPWHE